MYTKQEIIIQSYREGKSEREISRDLCISRKTVKRYITEYEFHKTGVSSKEDVLSEYLTTAPKYNTGHRGKRKLTKPIIIEIDKLLSDNDLKKSQGLAKQRLKNIDILELLHNNGHKVGYTTVCNYIRSKRNRLSTPEAYIRQEYAPGSVCEFDWGEIKLKIQGKLERYQLAVFTSAYSNYRYACIYKRQDKLAFMESHVEFFSYTSGSYGQMVYDNMRVAVSKFVGKYEKEPTESLLMLKGHYKFSHRFCNAYRGNEKGHVERSVEYIRRKAFGFKHEFEDIEQAKEHLLNAIEKINNTTQQLKGKTGKELFADEEPILLKVSTPLLCSEQTSSRVDKYATISLRTNRYSVPDHLVGQFLDVKLYSDHIKIYNKNTVIATHDRNYGKHEWIINIAHYLDTFKRKPGALMSSKALLSSSYLKGLYQEYFKEYPRDFIDLLHYCDENKIENEKIEASVLRLIGSGLQSITAEKIKALLGNKDMPGTVSGEPIKNETVDFAKKQLEEATKLMNFK